jgi:hypothetical protein
LGFFETYVKLSDEEEQRLRNEVNQIGNERKRASVGIVDFV